MTCGACVSTIESGLNKGDGVVKAKVALLSEKAEVLYDSHVCICVDVCVCIWYICTLTYLPYDSIQVTSAEKLKDLIENLGYDATLLKVRLA